jgi:transcriptional regulator with XRE-family HTH domain
MTHTHSGQRGRTAKTAEHPDFCPECRREYLQQQAQWDKRRSVESTVSSDLARRIVQGLMVRGYCLQYIADRVGVSKTHVSDWLNSKRVADMKYEARLRDLAREIAEVPASRDKFPFAERTMSLARQRGYRAVRVVS